MFDFLFNNDKKIEKERDKLISDLENGDIEYLLKQMDSKEIFSPLLLRKRKKVTSLTDDISWYAYRRAETLNSDSFKEQLISKVTNDLDFAIFFMGSTFKSVLSISLIPIKITVLQSLFFSNSN